MKTRFNTVDLTAIITELKQNLLGMRVAQVYDVDHKTYLIKLSTEEKKSVLLLESGIRLHTTDYEWPKSPALSGFSMKLRKHLRNRRLEMIRQLGVDRIVDMQFGINDAAYHVILELYDRGNIVLTDSEYIILNILRPRAKGSEDVKFVVREKYPVDLAQQSEPVLDTGKLTEIISTARVGDNLKKVLIPHVPYGPAVIEHVLLGHGFQQNTKIGKEFDALKDVSRLKEALQEAEKILNEASKNQCKGFIIQKNEKKLNIENGEQEFTTNVEFHPFLFRQHQQNPYVENCSFDKAVDQFFSSLEGQKIDLKAIQQEKGALKKLQNIKKDHEQRVSSLQKVQEEDIFKAQAIEINLPLVDKALLVVRSAIANQISWTEIWNIIQEAAVQGDPVAKAIKSLKLEVNHFTMLLDVQNDNTQKSEGNENEKTGSKNSVLVDINIDLSAYSNARKYYDKKRNAAKKAQKTLESSEKAFKSAEKKTKQLLKEVAVITTITKARKTFWFEKFLWFISSENYLVIGGRDIQQNELIVKKYLKQGDIYVHADLHGASSIVIKNPTGGDVPPKTLNEAGTMAVCYSAAWEAKIVTSAWWVYHHQVSKTAPSGEYLTSGAFMIRGKKNFLPPSHLIMGFGFLFKLDEDSVENHKEERKVKLDDGYDAVGEELISSLDIEEDKELPVKEDDLEEDQNENHEGEIRENIKSVPVNTGCEQNFARNDDVKKSNTDDENTSDDDESLKFPDTQVKLGSYNEYKSEACNVESLEDEKVVFLGDDQPVLIKSSKIENTALKKSRQKLPIKQDTSHKDINDQIKASIQPKRGQKAKMKRIKDKYKDQDEEERQLRMEILASAGGKEKGNKNGKSSKEKKQKQEKKKLSNQKKQGKGAVHFYQPNEDVEDTPSHVKNELPKQQITDSEHQVDGEVEDGAEEMAENNEITQLINLLTGIPLLDDTLLFALPVCAPYAAMQNYKFKVKVLPGTAKRGKAAKTALHSFLQDKITARDRDLLKSVKDQDISRNLPGKVKLVATSSAKSK
ncbi:nuclear export mediator factor NEMF-like [Limulus polyphemus]|uniref:Nuclear export mediator factor NEMF-like n=1 Tax=Limulus polyphemus TaxID=6850 RepID=A0ABM1B0Z5_LIMPO|nr:nuclear export mediator factor NEMF-like [Limulus polyphemus]